MRYQVKQIDIPLVRGVDGSVESRMQQPGALAVAENVIFQKPGRVEKRPAMNYDATLVRHDTTAINGSTARIADRDGHGVILNGGNVYEYSAARDQFKDLGPYPEASYPERQVISRASAATHTYSAGLQLNGYRIYAWIEEVGAGNVVGHLWASVHDADDTLIFRQQIAQTTCGRVRLFAIGASHAVVVWHHGAAAPYDIDAAVVALNAGTPVSFSAPVTLVAAALTADVQWDACGDANVGFVSYYDSTGPRVTTIRFTTALAITHTSNYNGISANTALTCFSDGTNLWVGCGESVTPTAQYFVRTSAALAAVLAVTPISAVAGYSYHAIVFESIGAGNAFLAFETSSVVAPYGFACYRTHAGTCDSLGVVTAGEITFWQRILSRPVKWSDKFYLVTTQQTTAQSLESAAYFVEVPTSVHLMRPVARIAVGGLSPIDVLPGLKQRNQITLTSNSMMWAGRELYSWEDGALGTAGTTRWEWEMLAVKGQQLVPFGRSLYMTGGLVSQIDGTHVAEVNFAYAPMVVDAAKTAGAGTYIYAFSYIWLDNEGKLHESSLGPVSYNMGQWQVGVTLTAATQPVTCTVQNICLTRRQRVDAAAMLQGNPLAIRCYRTQNGSPVLQFQGDYPLNPYQASTTFIDNGTSTVLNPPAYTEGALPYGQIVSARHLAVFDNRLVAAVEAGARFTTQATEDRAAQFLDRDEFTISTRDGDATEAVAVVDDALVLLKSDRAYLESGGQGPGPSGSPPYPEPRLLTSDVGCVNSLSVLPTPAGVIFESRRGLNMIPRGFGGVVWVGERPRDLLDAYPLIKGAALHPSRSLAFWSLSNVNVSDGRLLVLDYTSGEWTTWKVGNDSAYAGIAIVGEALWLGKTNILYREGGTGWATSGEGYVGSTITTEKIHPSGFVTGFSRVDALRVQGEYRGSCKLKLEANVDERGWTYAKEWTLTGTPGTRFVYEWVLPEQKGDIFQFRITDSVNGEAGATGGVVVHSLTYDAAAKLRGKPLHTAVRG